MKDGAGDEEPCIAAARHAFTCSSLNLSQFSKFREGSSSWHNQHSSSSGIRRRSGCRGLDGSARLLLSSIRGTSGRYGCWAAPAVPRFGYAFAVPKYWPCTHASAMFGEYHFEITSEWNRRKHVITMPEASRELPTYGFVSMIKVIRASANIQYYSGNDSRKDRVSSFLLDQRMMFLDQMCSRVKADHREYLALADVGESSWPFVQLLHGNDSILDCYRMLSQCLRNGCGYGAVRIGGGEVLGFAGVQYLDQGHMDYKGEHALRLQDCQLGPSY